jgi:transcriptional regulator with XRE-family HTH domain
LEGQELAARHIALREQAGLTQEQEAKAAGVSPTTISGIESGKIARPHLKTLLKLARSLGVDVGELRESGKAEAPPPHTQPPLNGFEEERREDRRADAARYMVEATQRLSHVYKSFNTVRNCMDQYREVWEARLADGDLDKAAIEEAGRAIKALWPAVATAAEAEAAELEQIGMPREEIKKHSVLLAAMDRFQALGERVNDVYREMVQDTQEATVYEFPHREAS